MKLRRTLLALAAATTALAGATFALPAAAQNYKSEYHVVDELRGAPTLGTYNPLQGSTPVVRP